MINLRCVADESTNTNIYHGMRSIYGYKVIKSWSLDIRFFLRRIKRFINTPDVSIINTCLRSSVKRRIKYMKYGIGCNFVIVNLGKDLFGESIIDYKYKINDIKNNGIKQRFIVRNWRED